MTKTRHTLLRCAAAAFMTAAALFSPATASADAGFETWINSFYATASQSGITKATYRKAFAGVKTPDPDVLQKAAYQPEFKHKIWEYIDSRVNPYTRKVGQEMSAKHARTLAALERHFGVDRNVLLAIWSMESNYGAVLEKDDRLHYVPRALATLAYADPQTVEICQDAADRRLEDPAEWRCDAARAERLLGRCHGPYAVHSDKLPALRR